MVCQSQVHLSCLRVWSLLEIMQQFKAEKLAALVAQFMLVEQAAKYAISNGHSSDRPHPITLQTLPVLIENAKQVFRHAELERSLEQLELAEFHLLQPTLNVSALSAEMIRIIETLTVELGKRKFIFVGSDRTSFFENELLFGPEVAAKFPLAIPDIKAAGNCLAAECTTAAVFHLMIAFEWALRTFCSDLGLRRMRDWNPKENKFRYTPASYAVWEKTLNQLPKYIDKRLNPLRPGPRKQKLQGYYSSALEDIKFVKDAWRNHIMHGRREYDRDEAKSICNHVEGIMRRLADGV